MTSVIEFLRSSPTVFILLSCIDNLLVITGCAMLVKALFRLPHRRSPVYYVICVLFCIAYGAVIPGAGSETADLVWSAVGMIYPFLCMALLFRGRKILKAMLVPLGYIIVDAIRYLLLQLFYHFDYNHRDNASELLFGIAVDLVFFLISLLLLTKHARRASYVADVTASGIGLFFLIVLSAAVLVTSLLVVGSERFDVRRAEYIFILLNIPVLSVTAIFAIVRYMRMKNEVENYKHRLEMQILQFEWMEQMIDDVRMFRHDLPKKMRPLIAMLEDERTEDAKELAEQFADFAAQTGERFHTGNYCLDTVLFCEQQIAERVGVTIEVPYGTVFPKDGIDADDIYTIFPNALDNAIEACKKIEGDRRIEFRSHYDKMAVYVTVRNPFAGDIKIINGIPQTNKEDKTAHGYGFRSLKKSASKYGVDNVSFSVEDGFFELRIFLNYRKK